MNGWHDRSKRATTQRPFTSCIGLASVDREPLKRNQIALPAEAQTPVDKIPMKISMTGNVAADPDRKLGKFLIKADASTEDV